MWKIEIRNNNYDESDVYLCVNGHSVWLSADCKEASIQGRVVYCIHDIKYISFLAYI